MARRIHKIVFIVIIAFVYSALVGFLYYYQTQRLLSENINTTLQQNLEKRVILLESIIKEVSNYQEQIVTNPEIRSYFNVQTAVPFTGLNTARILDILKHTYNISVLNPAIHDYFIFFKNSNVAASSSGAFDLERFFRGVLLAPDSDLDLKKIYIPKNRNRTYLPSTRIVYQDRNLEVISCVYPARYPEIKGSVVVLLDSGYLEYLLGGPTGGGGSTLIFLVAGTPLVSFGTALPVPELPAGKREGYFRTEIQGRRHVVFFRRGSGNEVTGIEIVPRRYYAGFLTNLRRLNLLVLIILVLLGIFFALLLARQSSKPMRSVIEFVQSQTNAAPGDSDAVEYIKQSFIELTSKESDFEARVGAQIEYLRHTLYRNLITGEIVSDKQAKERARQLDIDVSGSGYSVALIGQSGSPENDITEAVQNQIMKDRLEQTDLGDGGRLVVIEYPSSRPAVLLIYAIESDRDRQKACLDRFVSELQELAKGTHTAVCCGIGGVYSELVDIRRSFDEAQNALSTAISTDGVNVIQYEPDSESQEIYTYSETQENSLVNAIIAGEPERAAAILDSVMRENTEGRLLSPELLSLLIYQIQGSLMKLLGKKQIDPEVRQQFIHEMSGMHSSRTLDTNVSILKSEIESLSMHFQEKSASHSDSVIRRIMTAVEDQYKDPSLGLDMVADSLSMSPVYLSHLFAEKTGEKLSALIEKIRLLEGCRLLEETELTVKEIATEIGYASSGTFIRAFKRVRSTTPLAYRDSHS